MDFDKVGTGALILSILGALLVSPAASCGQALPAENAGADVTPRYADVPPRYDVGEHAATFPGLEAEGERKSPLGAAILGTYVPIAGYAYAGSWRKGIAPQALWFAFVGGMAYAAGCSDEGCSGTQETVGALAWTAGAVSVFWGGIGAFRTARSHNRALEERLQIEVRPGSDGEVSVGVLIFL